MVDFRDILDKSHDNAMVQWPLASRLQLGAFLGGPGGWLTVAVDSHGGELIVNYWCNDV